MMQTMVLKRRTSPHVDVVIEHVDFYDSIHTHERNMPLDLCGMLRFVATASILSQITRLTDGWTDGRNSHR